MHAGYFDLSVNNLRVDRLLLNVEKLSVDETFARNHEKH